MDNLRVCHEGAAGLIVLPMGQWWGSQRVSMTGIAGVAVAPEHRGGGLATELMRAAVSELHAAGVALSTLYPATVPLYQRAGYERAGARHQIRLDLRDLPACREGGLRLLDGPDDPGMREVYAAYARARNGYLDRGEYIWSRVFQPRGKGPVQGFAVGHEGYATVIHQQSGEDSVLEVTDWVATTAAAGQRLLGLLADYRSIARTATWHGASPDLFLTLLASRRHEIRLKEYWMLRLVDLEAALSQRGYPPISLDLGLEVHDDLLEANCGRWKLQLREGRLSLERGGDGGLRLGIRALASLYSGFLPCSTLVAGGLAEASPAVAERASALFAGPAPATADMF